MCVTTGLVPRNLASPAQKEPGLFAPGRIPHSLLKKGIMSASSTQTYGCAAVCALYCLLVWASMDLCWVKVTI